MLECGEYGDDRGRLIEILHGIFYSGHAPFYVRANRIKGETLFKSSPSRILPRQARANAFGDCRRVRNSPPSACRRERPERGAPRGAGVAHSCQKLQFVPRPRRREQNTALRFARSLRAQKRHCLSLSRTAYFFVKRATGETNFTGSA